MPVTRTSLTRTAGVAAVAAGLIFIGVQVNHPHLDATSIATPEIVIRNCLKVVMAALALAGITGMYLRQVKEAGVLGLVGYLLLALGYLTIMCTVFSAAFVLPAVAGTSTDFVNDVAAATTGGQPAADIGLLQLVIHIQDAAYLLGGLVFGIALVRARVLARWAAVLLAVSGPVSAALALMPETLYRLLALPNGIALIGLGCSLWWVSRPRNAPTSTANAACAAATGSS